MKSKLLATAAAFTLAVSIYPALAQKGGGMGGSGGGMETQGGGMGGGGPSGGASPHEQDQGIKSGKTEKGKGSMSREHSQSTKGSESKERASGKDHEKSKTRSSEKDRDHGKSTKSSERDHDRNTKSSDRDRDHNRNASDRDRDHNRNASDRDKNRSSADKGKSSDTHVTLNSTQKTKISTTVRSAHVEPLRHADFSIRVGVVVPTSVHWHVLPADVVAIVPEYRGYYFVIVEDEIVIIHPRTRKIVTIIEYRAA